MTIQVTLELPDYLYMRAQELAAQQQKDVARVITALLNEVLTAEEPFLDLTEPDPAVQRERDAFLAMYPSLVKEHFGQYVAIFQAKLIDHDVEFDALADRIEAQYPDDFVWITRVDTVPIPTLTTRSPRYSPDKPS